MIGLVLLAVLFPAMVALILAIGALTPGLRFAATVAGLPVLAIVAVAGIGSPWPVLDLDWLLLGSRFALDDMRWWMLLFAAILWAMAGLFTRSYLSDDPRKGIFLIFFLLTMTGNLGVIVSADVVSFYMFFTLMNFAAYGMVVHTYKGEAVRAARIYLIMVLVGEAFVLPGLWLASHAAGSLLLSDMAGAIGAAEDGTVIAALIVLGFGVKAGALPVHVWLPLAHPVAPTPASAVLSGAMIKAGLFAWITVLPVGDVALPEVGRLMLVMGLAAALYGALVGIVQTRPKTILAYSSISQMGFITVGVGLGLVAPSLWSEGGSGDGHAGPGLAIAAAAVLLYAIHHGLAKGALFLSVAVVETAGGVWRWVAIVLALIPAVAIAGLPFTSGVLAKTALKVAGSDGPGAWPAVLDAGLAVAAVGSTLLMACFFKHVIREIRERTTDQAAGCHRDSLLDGIPAMGLWLPWTGLIGVGQLLVWGAAFTPETVRQAALSDDYMWSVTWPILVGLGLFTVAHVPAGVAQRARARMVIPAGDILALVERPITGVLARLSTRVLGPSATSAIEAMGRSMPFRAKSAATGDMPERNSWAQGINDGLPRAETQMARWLCLGSVFLALTLALFLFGVLGTG